MRFYRREICKKMLEEGIEPSWPCDRWILNPVRLPISPLQQIYLMMSNNYLFGGAKEDRTPDLLHAMQALSRLSYSPE